MTSPADALVLIGPMGAGKTSVGRRVAKALGVAFTDTDAAVARAHGAIPAIFETHGEEQFRRWEREAVAESIAAGGVVSLGGGAVLHPDTQAQLADARVVLLTVSREAVAGRLRDGARPLVDGDDVVGRWSSILTARTAVYETLADVAFDTSTGPLQRVVDAVVAWARETTPPEQSRT